MIWFDGVLVGLVAYDQVNSGNTISSRPRSKSRLAMYRDLE